MMNWFFRYKLHHLLFWAAYFIFWTGYSIVAYQSHPLWALLITFMWFVSQAINAYISAYVLIPRFFNTKRYVLFTALFLLLWLACVLLVTVCMLPVLRYLTGGKTSFAGLLSYAMMANFYMLFLFLAIKTIKEKVQGEHRNKLLEKERTENELRFLKSQINPHFLFNAINSIYILIRTDPEVAASTLARFADMLRYQLYECNTEEIPIEKEVAYLNNYIEMEKMRKGSTVITHYDVDEQVRQFSIAPLLIIPFVENAFKYVSAFRDNNNRIDIALKYTPPFFELQVENTVDQSTTGVADKAYGGIGLENVKRRLELIYNGRHALHINATDTTYKVLLSIRTP